MLRNFTAVPAVMSQGPEDQKAQQNLAARHPPAMLDPHGLFVLASANPLQSPAMARRIRATALRLSKAVPRLDEMVEVGTSRTPCGARGTCSTKSAAAG